MQQHQLTYHAYLTYLAYISCLAKNAPHCNHSSVGKAGGSGGLPRSKPRSTHDPRSHTPGPQKSTTDGRVGGGEAAAAAVRQMNKKPPTVMNASNIQMRKLINLPQHAMYRASWVPTMRKYNVNNS